MTHQSLATRVAGWLPATHNLSFAEQLRWDVAAFDLPVHQVEGDLWEAGGPVLAVPFNHQTGSPGETAEGKTAL